MPLKVLYLDDETDLCEIFSDEFSSSEIQVKTFTIPSLMIKEVEKSPPDVLFLDYRLPGTTGDQIALTLPANIPKYLITGDVAPETLYKFLGVLKKPLDMGAIRKILNSYL